MMHLKKLIISLVTGVMLLTGVSALTSVRVNASTATGFAYTEHQMKSRLVTKTEPLYLVKVGKSEAQNHFYKHGYLKKGTKIQVSPWLMSTGGGYAVTFAGHHSSKHYFYFVPVVQATQWFK